MKFYLKRVLVTICLLIFAWILWQSLASQTKRPLIATPTRSHLKSGPNGPEVRHDGAEASKRDLELYQKIYCLINEDHEIPCVKTSNDNSVYIPFNFIEKYFEISGKIVHRKGGKEVFEWNHSYSKVYFPKQSYDSGLAFLWFDNYNVEVRDRVRCVSAKAGVPISSQWQARGHFYPIQIAQFGLSHFSKFLTVGQPRVVSLDSGDFFNRKAVTYLIPSDASLKRVLSEDNQQQKVLLINGRDLVIKIKRKSNNDLTLAFDVKVLTNFSLTAVLKSDAHSSAEYRVTYSSIDKDIEIISNHVIYGFGGSSNWRSLTRDLAIDLQKGVNIGSKKSAIKTRNMHIIRIEMNGNAFVDNIRLMSSAHETYAKTAADWFVDNQEPNGGFSIKVDRKLSNGALWLRNGWYSAMAQGQAISLLTRMSRHTADHRYLECAKKALQLFYVDSKDNGIRTKFIDQYVWFEEYPTIPSTYVLNGFIYSLFGLYDLSLACNDTICAKAAQLYRQGVQSLHKLLPLFDSGFGSLYDLRHLGLGSAPNRARWDYHSTHINQLLFLNTIENNLLFQTTAKRWISYMKGYRAPHN